MVRVNGGQSKRNVSTKCLVNFKLLTKNGCLDRILSFKKEILFHHNFSKILSLPNNGVSQKNKLYPVYLKEFLKYVLV